MLTLGQSGRHLSAAADILRREPHLIDYVLAHELAHELAYLHEADHTPEFWSIVSRLMPGYELQRANLAVAGKSIWPGAAAGGATPAATR